MVIYNRHAHNPLYGVDILVKIFTDVDFNDI